METQLPGDMVSFIEHAGQATAGLGQRLFMVGGVVRDLLLGRPTFDLDLVVEGDAIALAEVLAAEPRAKVTVHPAFNTAKLHWESWSVDIASARSETYSRPGALPTVREGTLQTDLFRRDFTINAMAVELTSGHYGDLIDLHGGQADLRKRAIRVLHPMSFTDDATRIWRAIRYEQRLSFHLEPGTQGLLVRDVPMLATISGDRIRHELEAVLKEDRPETMLRRAFDLGVLARLHGSPTADAWLTRKFRQARDLKDAGPLETLYLALLTYKLSFEDTSLLTSYLNLPRLQARVLEETLDLKAKLGRLTERRLKPSQIYGLLEGLSPAAITANQLATDSRLVRRRINLYLNDLRHTRPALTGDDLVKMGIPPGPTLKRMLRVLLEARLDSTVRTTEEEIQLAKRLRAADHS